MKRHIVGTVVGVNALVLLGSVAHVSAEDCYATVGSTICSDDPAVEQDAKEYEEWVEEQSQISTPMPEIGSEVIPVLPGPLLEGAIREPVTETPTQETLVIIHEPLVVVEQEVPITDIGSPPIPGIASSIDSAGAVTESAIRESDIIAFY